MKKILWIVAIVAFMAAAATQAQTVVYQSDFTGSDLGAGLTSAGAATDIWSLDAANDRAEFNDGDGVANSRAALYTSGTYQSDGGFTLDVTFYQPVTDLNILEFALVETSDVDFDTATASLNKDMPVYSIGFTASGAAAVNNGGPGLILNDGSTAKNNFGATEYLSNAQTYTALTEQTVSMTFTSNSWSYSVGGATASTGTFADEFDTSKSYGVVGFVQGNNSDSENVNGTYIKNITLTALTEPAGGGVVIDSSVTNGYAPLEVVFDGSGSVASGTITNYHWDFGDGNTANGIHVTNTYMTVGVYTSALVVADSNGLYDTNTVVITVNPVVNTPRPNVVFVFCDDLGYGDVHCLNPERGLIATPSADQLATEGMIFTDAHASSSVCTPSRYGLLTGRYNWRTHLQSGVVVGHADDLIAADRPTVASFLKGLGYQTAILGKWHLNFQYLDPDTGAPIPWIRNELPPVGAIIPDGPIDRGFDYYHGFHHAGDMKAVIENDEVMLYDDEINMLPRLTTNAVEYIDARAATPDVPFFLYVPLGSPHLPIVPSAAWQGLSELGPYGDFVMETDAALGAVMEALERNGFAENTLLIFSSDNGCAKGAGIPAMQAQGHYPSAEYRGSKADLWDGGHRIPFIVRWPGTVAPGSTSDQTICLVDFLATLSEITETALPEGSAEDSVSFLPALSGNPIVSTRNGVIHHSVYGYFAYRLGKWKLLLAKGSGGWTSPTEAEVSGDSPLAQLYDMENDPSETTNLYETLPDVSSYLLRQLESDVARGRSTSGSLATNDVDGIVLWKNGVPSDVASELSFPSDANYTTVDFENLSPATGSNNPDKFDGDGEPFATSLYIRGSSNTIDARVRALIKFDLSALGTAPVDSATLHLTGYSLNDLHAVSLQAVAAAADGVSVPSYTLGTLGTPADGGDVASGLDADKVRDYTLDVTEMVSAWMDGTWTNHGVVLQLSSELIANGVGFQMSGEDTPQLMVNGTEVAFTPTTDDGSLEILQHELLQEPDGPDHLISLIYRAQSAATYHLQKRTNLVSGSWSTVYSQPSTDNTDRFSISLGTETSAYFRVSTEDVP